MGKINYECEHSFGNGLGRMCEFNDKACPFEDVMECDIVKQEYNETIEEENND